MREVEYIELYDHREDKYVKSPVCKVGDIVKMRFGISDQRITSIPFPDYVNVCDTTETNWRGKRGGVGMPLYWVESVIKEENE